MAVFSSKSKPAHGLLPVKPTRDKFQQGISTSCHMNFQACCLSLPLYNSPSSLPCNLTQSNPLKSVIYPTSCIYIQRIFSTKPYNPAMLNTKKLAGMVRKWRKLATSRRRRIMPAGADGGAAPAMSNSSVASRGHVFVYTTDGKRFMVPLTYLNNGIFRELFKMSEEEFGLPSNGPITLPCDATNMEYIISLLQSRVSRDVERDLVASIAQRWCTTSSLLPQGRDQQHLILHGF